MKFMAMALLLGSLVPSLYGESISGICVLSVSRDKAQNADMILRRGECGNTTGNCGISENSSISWRRWTGVSPETLRQEGAQLNGRMTGEAGELDCRGIVHDGLLVGRYEFTPDPAFVKKMAALGFDGITPNKQEGFLMLDIDTEWVQQMKTAGLTEMTTNNLMGLKALHVDPDYVHQMAAAGYPELRANKLTEMKAVGVTPDKVREARALGFQPTEQELIQMCIFKIDRPFVERMRAKGLDNLTLAKLIKVKIFKLEE